MQDTLIWHYSPKGVFSVKSAYHVACTLRNVDAPSRSHNPSDNWNFIWRANLPHKIRVFIWRVCRGILPTLSNLIRRRCNVETICPCCSMHEESDSHILLHCDLARQIWSLSNILWVIIADWSDSAHEWIRKVLAKVTEEEGKLFLTLCWAIWSACNKMLWETNQPNPLSIVLGCLAWLMRFVPHIYDPETAEAMATQEAIDLARRHGWDHIVVEVFYVSEVRRTDNYVAHSLARSATVSQEGSVDPPMFLFPVLLSNITSDDC
ncbi:hypothetical protein BUALT_Bualt06G0014700 [Buddleja alternifolia]|uniref:Reverse transcriptase zinc-binding domain-containing protein n=1 Tax=Buddleja alternifolia TaxID=168488 RepID=A0AAV6XK92_9LAMI|nr:hypothetical protein BUALT_Bualt06G0014700 [Buddleja alternifolia]